MSWFNVGLLLYLLLLTLTFVYWIPLGFTPDVSWGYATSCLALLTIIPATKNSVLTWFLFTPFERTVTYHRWLGRFTLLACVAHAAYFYTSWGRDGTLTSAKVWGNKKYRNGLLGLIFLALIVLSSFSFIRRRWYRLFRILHFSFFGFYIFGVLHTATFTWYAVASLILYVTDAIMRYTLGLFPASAVSLDVLANDVIRVRFPKHKFKTYRAAQYVFLNFPTLSSGEWHPFTLSSGPHDDFLEVHIKALGKYTNKLHDMAKTANKLPRVRVDGPYGHIAFNYKRYQTVVLVAGGVGATPQISILKDIYHIGGSINSDGEASPTYKDVQKPRSPFVKTVHFIWTVRSCESWGWFIEILAEAKALSDRGIGPKLVLDCYLTGSSAADRELDFFRGVATHVEQRRPNMETILGKIQQGLGSGRHRTAVLACGPEKLITSAWDATTKLSRSDNQFDFHQEIFEF